MTGAVEGAWVRLEGKSALAVLAVRDGERLVLNRLAGERYAFLAEKGVPCRIECADLDDVSFLRKTYRLARPRTLLARLAFEHLGEAEIAFLKRAPKLTIRMLNRAMSVSAGVTSAYSARSQGRMVFQFTWSRWHYLAEVTADGEMTILTMRWPVSQPRKGQRPWDWDYGEPDDYYSVNDRFRVEYQGKAPAGLVAELFDDPSGSWRVASGRNERIVEDWIRREILPRMADPLVTIADVNRVEVAAIAAPLAFANGNERMFTTLMRWLRIAAGMKREPVPDTFVFEAAFTMQGGRHFPARNFNMSLDPGLERVFQAIIGWMRPEGSAERAFRGPRRSDVTIGPALRYFNEEGAPSGHERLEATAGLTQFLKERGWLEAEIGMALGL